MSCPFNESITACKKNEKKCHKCGWNPEVAKARIEKLKSKPLAPMKGKKHS